MLKETLARLLLFLWPVKRVSGPVVNFRSCRSFSEAKAIAAVADNLFEKYTDDTGTRKVLIGDANVSYGSAKLRATGWHLVRTLVARNSKSNIVVEQPILSRQKVTTEFDGAGFRVGLGGFWPRHCQAFSKQYALSLPRPPRPVFGSSKYEVPHKVLLVVGQLPNDAALNGQDIFSWIDRLVLENQNRFHEIIVRAPQIRQEEYISRYSDTSNVSLSVGSHANKLEDLCRSTDVATFSSTFAIDALMHGNRVFADSEVNFLYGLVPTSSRIGAPYPQVDRLAVIEEIRSFEYHL